MYDKNLIRKLIETTLMITVPVAVAVLVQKPAARQMAWMRTTHAAKTFCQVNADFWQVLALKAGTAYNRAKL